jgi:hypothetical protein
VFAAPAAAYTRVLIDAIPLPAVDPGWLMRTVAVEGVVTTAKKPKRERTQKSSTLNSNARRRPRAARRDPSSSPDRR